MTQEIVPESARGIYGYNHLEPAPERTTFMKALARPFIMTDEVWNRHANPWSVYTRFPAIPAMIFAIWNRVWIGWWAMVPVGAVVVWLWRNPHVFPAVAEPRSWAAKGIYGEKLWLLEPSRVSEECRLVLRWLELP